MKYTQSQFYKLQTDFYAKIQDLIDRVTILEHKYNKTLNIVENLNKRYNERQTQL